VSGWNILGKGKGKERYVFREEGRRKKNV